MADNIGVLGSSTAVAVATATVYTCPANKAAKFRIMGMFQGSSDKRHRHSSKWHRGSAHGSIRSKQLRVDQ